MKISHEVPRCLLTAQYEFNDYLYCLPHLLDKDKEYQEFFLEAKHKGNYIIMDNSLHELGEAYDHKRLLHWIQELEPDEFIVPDVWMKQAQTCAQAKYWLQYKYPKKTNITAVVQGEDEEKAYLCAMLLKDLGYKKLNISYGATWYGDTALDKALGRIKFVKRLLNNSNFKDIKFHLLGCSIPQEFGWYDNNPRIESIDTSNPIMAALEGTMYSEHGLNSKPKANMNDHFNIIGSEVNWSLLVDNLRIFRKINGL